MEDSGHLNSGHIMLAMLGGALAGASLALLLAPKSGRETRQQLTGYVENAKEKVSLVPEAFVNAGNAAKDAMVNSVNHL